MAPINLSIPSGPSSFYGLGARLPAPLNLAQLLAHIASLRQQTNTSPSAAAGQVGSGGMSGMMGAGLVGPSLVPHAPLSPISPTPLLAGGPPRPANQLPAPRMPTAAAPAAPGAPAYPSDADLQAQASQYVTTALQPLIKAAQDAENARAAAGEQAIKGYSSVLADALAKYGGVANDIYSGAQSQQQAGDQALASELRGVGSQVAGGLPDALAQAALGRGAGSAGAASAVGNSSLSQLVGDSAAAQNYAAKQPEIAQSGALQSSRGLEAQTSSDLSNQIGQINAQAPGMVQSIFQQLVGNRETQRQGDRTRQDAKTQQTQQNVTTAYNAGLVSQRSLGQALGLPNWQSLPDTPKPAANAGKTITVRPGDTVIDATSGKVLASIPPTSAAATPRPIVLSPGQVAYLPNGKTISGPQKPTTGGFTLGPGQTRYEPGPKGYTSVTAPGKQAGPPAPFTLSPGQTRVIPNGDGTVTKITAPAAPDTKAPAHFTAGNGQEYTFNKTTQTWDPVAGTQKPAAPKTIIPASLAPTSPRMRYTDGTDAGGNPGYKGANPPSVADMKTGLAALATLGGVNWKTGQTTPTFRVQARALFTRANGADPGPLPAALPPQDLATLQKFLGVTPPKSSTGTGPRLTGFGPGSKYEIDTKTGKPVRVNPNHVPPATRTSAKQTPSYTDIKNAKADAADSAKDAYYGVPDNIQKTVVNGKVVAKNEPIPKRSYKDAKQDLVQHGIPEDIAVKALNRYYKPGERGRPATTSDYLRDKAIVWQRDNNGNIVAYRVYTNKKNGTQRREAIGTISPRDPNYKAALRRAQTVAA